VLYTSCTLHRNVQESRPVARKPRAAAAVLFGLKFADDIHYKFKSSHASFEPRLQSSKHTGTKQKLTQNGDSRSFKVTCFGVYIGYYNKMLALFVKVPSADDIGLAIHGRSADFPRIPNILRITVCYSASRISLLPFTFFSLLPSSSSYLSFPPHPIPFLLALR